VAVVQEAYVQGISTRRVDDLVQALGMQGISKSQVSRLCAELDREVERFRTRKLEGPYPYVWLDGTFVKVRENGRVVSQAIVIAIAVTANGEREVLGLDVGPSESAAFWLAFLRDVAARGLNGVKLVISDAHAGLKAAIAAVLQGAGWQCCRVHFMRDALGLVQKSAQQMVAATIRTVFAQPDAHAARERAIAGVCPAHPETKADQRISLARRCLKSRGRGWLCPSPKNSAVEESPIASLVSYRSARGQSSIGVPPGTNDGLPWRGSHCNPSSTEVLSSV
jgi:transposase-like protein